jgi:hypothetical protein
VRYILLAVVLGTLPIAWMLWREWVEERHNWQREQDRRQDMLMRVDVEVWTDRVGSSLARTGKSLELDRVRPLPKPTLWHRGAFALSWLTVVAIWLVSVMVCYTLMTLLDR